MVFERVDYYPVEPWPEGGMVAQAVESGESCYQAILVQVITVVAVAHELPAERSGPEMLFFDERPEQVPIFVHRF
jgi:hypothetical protein